ncbi:MAG: exodeoxyribonuclease III [candidate division KSB1 bacterium]|jgi:exodeoxyribonuclease-3|nr:exodeoxyribonuclease III [candidate division KSB1 bacterium]
MKTDKLISWNVNGVRAIHKKGFLNWLKEEDPDILCLQETKAMEEQLPDELRAVEGYRSYYASAERKGYSGVAIYTREKPLAVHRGMGIPEFDIEGRVLHLEYAQFHLLNIYFPNGKASKERLRYKMAFYDAFLGFAVKLKEGGKHVVMCGDVNTAHKEIDLARPKENRKTSGFLPGECAWMDAFVEAGFSDTFRMFEKEGGHYTWWDLRTRARDRDIGWRIDYFFVNDEFKKNVTSGFILKEVMGSDHCPIGIEITT